MGVLRKSKEKGGKNLEESQSCNIREASAATWISLLEVLRVYVVIRFQIKIVNLCIGRKRFANLLAFS